MSANLGGLAYALALKTFGRGLKMNTSIVSLTVVKPTVTKILLNSPDRIFWLLMNRSPYHVEFNFTDSWTYGQGLLLSPNGGQVSMQANEDGESVSYEVWMQTPVQPASIYVVEIVGQ